MDLAAIWLSLVTNVFNLQALVMALITIGLITIMTGLHYLPVQRIRWTALIHGIEVFCILLSYATVAPDVFVIKSRHLRWLGLRQCTNDNYVI